MAISLDIPTGSPVGSYGDLLELVPEYLDGRRGADQVPHFVALVEGEINRRLALKPVLPMSATSSLTVAGEYAPLPDLFLKPITLEILDGTVAREVTYVDPANVSQLKAVEDLYRRRVEDDFGAISAPPRHYTITADGLRFFPVPQAPYSATFSYYQRVQPLSVARPVNWFLTDNPDVYLYGTLAHAYAFLPDTEKAGYWAGLFDSRLNSVLEAYPKVPVSTELRPDLPSFSGAGFYAR